MAPPLKEGFCAQGEFILTFFKSINSFIFDAVFSKSFQANLTETFSLSFQMTTLKHHGLPEPNPLLHIPTRPHEGLASRGIYIHTVGIECIVSKSTGVIKK